MGSGSLVDEDEIQVVKIGEEGDEDDQGEDEDREGEGERMEGAEQEEDGDEEGESEENDGQTLKVIVMQDECEDGNEEDERKAEEPMDTGTLEHMKDITEKENPADDKKKIENEENTADMNGDVKWSHNCFYGPYSLQRCFTKLLIWRKKKDVFSPQMFLSLPEKVTVLRREWSEEESVTALTLHLNPLLCINPQVCLINTK